MQTPWFITLPFIRFIHFHSMETYYETRFEKDTRYYVIRLSKDLLDDWVITLINGRIKSKLGQSRTLAFLNFPEAFEHFCLLAHMRHQRGYTLKTVASENSLLLHILPFFTENTKQANEGDRMQSLTSKSHQPTRNQNRTTQNAKILPRNNISQMEFLFAM